MKLLHQSVLPLALSISGFAGETAGQFLNRAIYLGRDGEGIRRDFKQDEEYFFNRFSYLHAPWWKDDLDPFRPLFDYAIGSISTSGFTIEGALHVEAELGEGSTMHYHVLQSENQDTQFLRNAIEFEYDVSPGWSGFVQVEGTADKADGDGSFGVRFKGGTAYGIRVMLTAADMVSQKNDELKYIDDPYGIMLSGWIGDADGSQLGFELASQLPAQLVEMDFQRTFEIQRYIGRLEGRVHLVGDDWLVAVLDFEDTSKKLTPFDTASPEHERLRRDYLSLSAEWWRRYDHGGEFSTGVFLVHKHEDGYRPNEVDGTMRLRREEAFGFVRGRFRLSAKWSLEPSLIAGYVHWDELVGDGTPDRKKFSGFQGKAGAGLLYRFGPRAEILLNPTIELDRLHFGGGNIQFKAYF